MIFCLGGIPPKQVGGNSPQTNDFLFGGNSPLAALIFQKDFEKSAAVRMIFQKDFEKSNQKSGQEKLKKNPVKP